MTETDHSDAGPERSERAQPPPPPQPSPEATPPLPSRLGTRFATLLLTVLDSRVALAALIVVAAMFGPGLVERWWHGPKTDLSPRIERMEDQIVALSQRAPAAIDLGPIDRRIAALDSRQADLAARLAAVDDGDQEREQQRDRQRLAALEGAVADLGRRADQQQQAARAAAEQSEQRMAGIERRLESLAASAPSGRAAALVVALGRLRDAADRGHAFAAERDLLAAAAAGIGDDVLDQALGRLAIWAGEGVPSAAALAAAFPDLARSLARGGDQESGWLAQAGAEIARLVSVRRTGADVEGVTGEAVAARAEAKLLAGDLTGALTELEALGEAAAPAQAWMAQARDRIELDATLATIAERVLAVAAPVAGGGN